MLIELAEAILILILAALILPFIVRFIETRKAFGWYEQYLDWLFRILK